MQRLLTLAGALTLAILGALPARAVAAGKEEGRLVRATSVLEEFRSEPDRGLPTWMLERAYGVAVIPEVVRGAFWLGGRYGKGVMTIREASGRFGGPIFVSLTGGSWGAQFGAQSADIVLVFATKRSVDEFGRGDFMLGGSASVAAGPVGRSGEAAAGKSAEVYSYSRSRGLFLGIALDGTWLKFDSEANRRFYNAYAVDTGKITSGEVHQDSEAVRRFLAAVATSANVTDAQPPATPAQPVAQPGATAPPINPPAPGAQPFPMEDPHPGAEPH